MCTLAVGFQVHARWPLLVAANRDARAGRGAESWSIRSSEAGVRYAAPRDLVGGGTWIGLSASGVFSAVTTYYVPGATADPGRRSRGELVGLALRHRDAGQARAALPREDAARHNPFNLFVADADRAFVWSFDGREASVVDLGPGLHVITNRALDFRVPRRDLARERWPGEPEVEALRQVLTIHGPGREATCFHTEANGTCSSSVLRIAPSLAGSDLHVADGRPCLTPLEDRSALLRELAEGA